ncbi:MAG TPA: response regulator transcription factor [Candidatus Polarisedimenticolia bacterium]|nr:response regulator transcription factor [Candidatus Polarisedimenticolia bacterium]
MTSNARSMARSGRKVSRVLIVDDHSLVRHGLRDLIEDAGLQVAGEAADAASALQMVETTDPDLIIIDLSLKTGSGIELIKQVKMIRPSARMLVLSVHDEAIYGERALRAGAMGYISKQEPTEKILEAVRNVLAGKMHLSSGLADRVLHRLVHRRDDGNNSPVRILSDRELEVLGLIGQGLTSREMAQRLHLSIKTIDTYREHIKTKLHLRTANELVRYAVTWSNESA